MLKDKSPKLQLLSGTEQFRKRIDKLVAWFLGKTTILLRNCVKGLRVQINRMGLILLVEEDNIMLCTGKIAFDINELHKIVVSPAGADCLSAIVPHCQFVWINPSANGVLTFYLSEVNHMLSVQLCQSSPEVLGI